jgi:hypothetical protein
MFFECAYAQRVLLVYVGATAQFKEGWIYSYAGLNNCWPVMVGSVIIRAVECRGVGMNQILYICELVTSSLGCS